MKKSYEMLVNEYFKISSGHIAFVGEITPRFESFIGDCNAHLYIEDEFQKLIHIIGEDRFVRTGEKNDTTKRAVRTDENIYEELKLAGDKKIKLVFVI